MATRWSGRRRAAQRDASGAGPRRDRIAGVGEEVHDDLEDLVTIGGDGDGAGLADELHVLAGGECGLEDVRGVVEELLQGDALHDLRAARVTAGAGELLAHDALDVLDVPRERLGLAGHRISLLAEGSVDRGPSGRGMKGERLDLHDSGERPARGVTSARRATKLTLGLHARSARHLKGAAHQ